jgi:TolB-like protein/Tfp pilus assembly protein PilF
LTLFGELQRRNVFRVGIAYAVASWILIQVADTLIPMLGLPDWVPKFVLFLLLIGFVPALIFAWAFELTPDGVKRDSDIDPGQSIASQTGKKLNHAIVILLALAVAYLMLDKFSGSRDLGSESNPIVASAVSPDGEEGNLTLNQQAAEPAAMRQSIAVLPFDNRSKLEDDAFFVEGIHDDLLTNLARISDLKVISRTSVSRYIDTKKSIPEIARELGVATVMEGAVQRAGDMVRINVQLIDAETDEHLWAEIFDRELTADNLFAIQSEISQEIAKTLSTTLSPEEQRRVSDRPTENLAAYSAYLRGRQLMARRTSAELDQAEKEFLQAVELDPEFALAWVAIAENAMHQKRYGVKDIVLARQQRQDAVEKALAINDQLGEAHLSRATLLVDANRPKEAEAAFKRAIELNPGYATAYHWYGDFLEGFPHRLGEAGLMFRKALELDPMSSIMRVNMGNYLRNIGRLEQAEAAVKEVQSLDPGFASAYGSLSDIAGDQGRYDEDLRWKARRVEIDPGNINAWASLMWPLMSLGETAPFESIRRRVEAIDDQNPALGWVDAFRSMYANQNAATIEHLDWIYQKRGADPFMYRFKGYLYNHMREFDRARTSWEISDPEFFDRARWREGIEDKVDHGCLVADILIRTGDEEMGLDLLKQSIDYMENELPQYVEHADRWPADLCYLALGEPDKAMAAIEQRLEHGHGWSWFFMRKEPQYEPLWGTPRFEAVWQEIQNDLVAQRKRAAKFISELGL